jgi:hypothetical protein
MQRFYFRLKYSYNTCSSRNADPTRQQNLAPTALKAQLLPSSNVGMLAVNTGDIQQTLKSMRDQEKDMQLKLNDATIYTLTMMV